MERRRFALPGGMRNINNPACRHSRPRQLQGGHSATPDRDRVRLLVVWSARHTRTCPANQGQEPQPGKTNSAVQVAPNKGPRRPILLCSWTGSAAHECDRDDGIVPSHIYLLLINQSTEAVWNIDQPCSRCERCLESSRRIRCGGLADARSVGAHEDNLRPTLRNAIGADDLSCRVVPRGRGDTVEADAGIPGRRGRLGGHGRLQLWLPVG